jgi:hypothetical protein
MPFQMTITEAQGWAFIQAAERAVKGGLLDKMEAYDCLKLNPAVTEFVKRAKAYKNGQLLAA